MCGPTLSAIWGTSQPLARILVSEDNPDILYIYSSLLPDYGFELICVPNGDGALTFELAQRTIPQLVITDINKPTMNGYALTAALHATSRTAHIPVLMVTAMDIRSKIALADDYIVKPFLFANLLYRIMMMLRLSVPAREALVDQALRLPCYEPSHPFSGQPSFHHTAEQLPAYTALQGWAALEIDLVNYHDLARTYGWPLVYTFISRISQAINRIVGPDLLVGHTGFDSTIVIVGPTAQIIQVERLLAPYFANFSQYCVGLSQLLTVQISLRHADDRAGLALSLPALRAALH